MGARTMLAVPPPRAMAVLVAGVVLVVGVQYLRLRRRREHSRVLLDGRKGKPRATSSANGPRAPPSQAQVGLLRMRVTTTWRDVIKNDVLVDKTIAEVGRTLLILVVGRDKHEIVRYTSELYNLCWDAACAHKKPQLDIKILAAIAHEATRVWDELLLTPELNAVFGEEEAIPVQELNTRRAAHGGLLPVVARPLAMYIKRYLQNSYQYFEDDHVDLREHSIVLVGGTFDHLHNGHKKLLALALSICKGLLVVGITGESMLKNKKHAHLIESLAERQRHVAEFVAFCKPSVHVEFVELSDPYGPALTIKGPAAIVMSTETMLAAETIDAKRKIHNLHRLDVYVCRRTDASTLSSSFIRQQLATLARAKK